MNDLEKKAHDLSNEISLYLGDIAKYGFCDDGTPNILAIDKFYQVLEPATFRLLDYVRELNQIRMQGYKHVDE